MNIVAFRPGLRTCPASSPPIGKKVIMPIIMLSQSVFTYFFFLFSKPVRCFSRSKEGFFLFREGCWFFPAQWPFVLISLQEFSSMEEEKITQKYLFAPFIRNQSASRWSLWIMRLSEFWQVLRAKGLAAGNQFSRGEGSERSYCNLRPTDNCEGWESNKDKRPGSVAGEVQIAFPSCFDLFQ